MGYGERFTVNASEAMIGNEKRALSLTYDHPLGMDGLKLVVGGSFTRTTPGSTLREFEVRTKTTEATVDLTYPVIRSRAETLTVGAGFTIRNASVNLLGAPFNQDRLRLLRAEASYGNSAFLGGSSRIVVSATQSIKGLDATNPRETTMSRDDAVMDFARLNIDVSHARPLFAGVNIRLSGTAQYATEPAPASEEFSLGGDGFGRAYNSGEISGEDGFGISAEVTYNLDYRNDFIRFMQSYGFFDYGKTWDRRSASSLGPADSLASTGFGLRIGLPHGMSLRLERATPLTRPPSHQNGGTRSRIFVFSNWVY